MKKLAIALVCVLMTAGAATAQQFTWGPKVGVDLTNFWGKGVNHGMQFNYQAGLFGEYRFANSNVAIAPEVVFAAQGGRYSKDKNSLTYTTNYINVPVMLKYYVSPAVSIDLGPQVGFNVYSKSTIKVGDEKATVDLKDGTKTVDFGVGLGLTYNLSPNAFVQGRYTMGMTKVFEVGKAKNGNIQVAFGYRF